MEGNCQSIERFTKEQTEPVILGNCTYNVLPAVDFICVKHLEGIHTGNLEKSKMNREAHISSKLVDDKIICAVREYQIRITSNVGLLLDLISR